MISLFRQFTKSWIFIGLMGLLILSFAIFGMSDVFRGGGGNTVVEAGKRTVSVAEFKTMFDNYKQRVTEQRGGQAFTNEEFVAEGGHVSLVEQLAEEESLAAWLDKNHIKASARLIVDELAKIPDFFNSATGRFDRETYLTALARRNMNEKTVERQFGDQIASQQFGSAAFAGFRAPRIMAAAESAFSMQTRDFSYFYVTPNSVAQPPMPTDADIQAFYKENLARLTPPETREASIVTLSVEQFLASAQVSDDAVRKAYEARLPTLKTPETRSFVQITAPDMKAANAISSALKSGQSPDVVAKANKGTVQRIDRQAQSAVADEKVAAAAFALKSGETSAPVQGDLGIAVVRVDQIHAGSTPSFESLRGQISNDLKREAAADKLNEASHKLADALAAGDDFNATAQKLGLQAAPLPPMTVEGKTPIQGRDYSQFPQIVKAIYDLQPGAVSDVQEAGPGQYFAVKLNKVNPATPAPLEAVKGQLAEAWRAQKAAAAVEEKAEALAERLGKGEAIATLAAEAKSPAQSEKGLDRSGGNRVPPQITGRVFNAKGNESFHIAIRPDVILVGRLDAVHQGQVAAINTTSAAMREQINRAVAQDVGGLARTAARKDVKVKTYPNAAISALGVTPPAKDEKAKDAKEKS